MKQRKKTVTRQKFDDARKFFDKHNNNVIAHNKQSRSDRTGLFL